MISIVFVLDLAFVTQIGYDSKQYLIQIKIQLSIECVAVFDKISLTRDKIAIWTI